MFTLKLYRRMKAVVEPVVTQTPNGPMVSVSSQVACPSHLTTKVVEVEEVHVHQIGVKGRALEIHLFGPTHDKYGDTYYIGEPEEGMDAFGKEDLHLHMEPYSWWGWGLLENASGKTTEHFRPANWG